MKFSTAWKMGRASYRNFRDSPPRSPSRTVPADPGMAQERSRDEATSTACGQHAKARVGEGMQPSTSRAQQPDGLAASQPGVNHDDEASFDEGMPPTTSAPYAELEDPSSQLTTRPLERLSNDQLLVFSAKVYDHTSLRHVVRNFRFSAFSSTHGVHMSRAVPVHITKGSRLARKTSVLFLRRHSSGTKMPFAKTRKATCRGSMY
ncbi:hypothetical protein Aduo_009072 [Ancylostoma duodenale]